MWKSGFVQPGAPHMRCGFLAGGGISALVRGVGAAPAMSLRAELAALAGGGLARSACAKVRDQPQTLIK
tara:strand:+ start:2245 stop:2451 length:207 start_codon:yes stop_codon:yes gene_type:complete